MSVTRTRTGTEIADRCALCGGWVTEVSWSLGETSSFPGSPGTCQPAGRKREMETESQMPDPKQREEVVRSGETESGLQNPWHCQGLTHVRSEMIFWWPVGLWEHIHADHNLRWNQGLQPGGNQSRRRWNLRGSRSQRPSVGPPPQIPSPTSALPADSASNFVLRACYPHCFHAPLSFWDSCSQSKTFSLSVFLTT